MLNVTRQRSRLNSLFIYGIFLVFTLIVLVPIYWMARSSVAVVGDLYEIPLIYFPTLTLKNFQTLSEQVPLALYIRNSLIFATATTIATLVVSYLAAYAFARIDFPGSALLMWILVLSSALPDIGTI